MQHSFDIDIAKEYGILEAILLNNLWFWIEKNKANGNNYYDGNYWTFNSTRAFNELFPYASQRRIQNALKHLKDEEIIITGNYNKSTYDRTLWYAFTKKGKCIMQKCKMEDAEMENGSVENGQPIPDINTNEKPNKKPYRKKEQKKDEKIYLSPLGEFKNVLLTKEELEKINERKLGSYIEALSTYLENNPKKKYASHYATILTWYRRDEKSSSKQPVRKEMVPEWIDKKIETKKPTADDQKAFDELDEVLAERVEKLKERIGTN